jgi:hypothetical protein
MAKRKINRRQTLFRSQNLIVPSSLHHDQRDLIEALHQLGQKVIAGEEEFFRRRGFAGSEDFYDGLVVLSAVVVKSIWNSDAGPDPV